MNIQKFYHAQRAAHGIVRARQKAPKTGTGICACGRKISKNKTQCREYSK